MFATLVNAVQICVNDLEAGDIPSKEVIQNPGSGVSSEEATGDFPPP